jgi:hypothetical protein
MFPIASIGNWAEFLATDPMVPGSIPAPIRYFEK